MPALIDWMDPIGEPQIGNHGRLEIKQQLQSADSGTLQTGGRTRSQSVFWCSLVWTHWNSHLVVKFQRHGFLHPKGEPHHCSGTPNTSCTKPFTYTDSGDVDVLGKASSTYTEVMPTYSKEEKDHQALMKWVRVRRSLAEFWKGAWFDSESVPRGAKPRQKLSVWNRPRNRENDFQCQRGKPRRHLNQNLLAIKNRKYEKLKVLSYSFPTQVYVAPDNSFVRVFKKRLSFALRKRQRVWHNPHTKGEN